MSSMENETKDVQLVGAPILLKIDEIDVLVVHPSPVRRTTHIGRRCRCSKACIAGTICTPVVFAIGFLACYLLHDDLHRHAKPKYLLPLVDDNSTQQANEKALLGYALALWPRNVSHPGHKILNNSRRLATSDHFRCDPVDSGELRILSSNSQCLDVGGSSGDGWIYSWDCTAKHDQHWTFCLEADAGSPTGTVVTIRNRESHFVVEESGRRRWHLHTHHFKEKDARQRWYLDDCRNVDVLGQPQQACRLKNRATQHCLDPSGVSGHRKYIGTYHCDGNPDQYFFFYNRGKLVSDGSLVNGKSSLCLDVHGQSGHGEVSTYGCEGQDAVDQIWWHYSTGEIVNAQSRHCLDASGSDGWGRIGVWDCQAERDQTWYTAKFSGQYVMLKNKMSEACLDVDGSDGKGIIWGYYCQYQWDQVWRWQRPEEITLSADWQKVMCHNTDFTRSITLGFAELNSFSYSLSLEVSARFMSKTPVTEFEKELTITLAQAWQWTWEKSWSFDETREVSCIGGCLWQMGLDIHRGSDGWHWRSSHSFCSEGKPTCQPIKSNYAGYCYR